VGENSMLILENEHFILMLSSTNFRYTFFKMNSFFFLIMKLLHDCFYAFVFTKKLIISIYSFLQKMPSRM